MLTNHIIRNLENRTDTVLRVDRNTFQLRSGGMAPAQTQFFGNNAGILFLRVSQAPRFFSGGNRRLPLEGSAKQMRGSMGLPADAGINPEVSHAGPRLIGAVGKRSQSRRRDVAVAIRPHRSRKRSQPSDPIAVAT